MINSFIGLCRYDKCNKKEHCERFLSQIGEEMDCHLVCDELNLYWENKELSQKYKESKESEKINDNNEIKQEGDIKDENVPNSQ